MIINRGTPQYPGRYACYMHGVAEPTVIRVWKDGWQDGAGNPIAGTVAGWIGPLPSWPANSVSPPKQDFDL